MRPKSPTSDDVALDHTFLIILGTAWFFQVQIVGVALSEVKVRRFLHVHF